MLKRKLVLLLTSVGSMVGKNILDCLQGRRGNVRVIGCNSMATAANNFCCDAVYWVPPAQESLAYRQRLLEIIEQTQADLVLPGRDDDVGILAQMAEDHPQIAAKLPVGSAAMAKILGDKWLSYQFAQERGLPFVDTVRANRQDLMALLKKHGFPLIAKPAHGNGSRGTRVIFDEQQLWRAAEHDELIFQPYINASHALTNHAYDFSCGIPLFFTPLIREQIAMQASIDASGRVRGILCTENVMSGGRGIQAIRLSNATLSETAQAIAQSFADAGWRGCLNIQGRITEEGQLTIFELNGRMTGSTWARLLLGFDELGLLVHHFVGENAIARSPYAATPVDQVQEVMTYYPMNSEDCARLQSDRYWQSHGIDSEDQ